MIPLITLIQQMIPYFIEHRDLYEVREAPSKMYSWFAFIAAQITSEIPIQIVVGTFAFFAGIILLDSMRMPYPLILLTPVAF